ncbi:MerR family transcriptional regulator [Streptomyces sp. NPDC053493]|uniref:MerR family transcriptional regulator n=1 Tax=Streptomyces sp. NPDC053493 TaxID=3365705 RepID=UPI0037D65C43
METTETTETTDRKSLLPIGQFAQASGLTITALRHYDAAGVLVPAHVDPVSGYRWFRRDQVRTAQLIRALRQLDIPVEEVRRLVTAESELGPALHARLRAAERRLEVQRSVVHSLLTRLGEGADVKHPITIREGEAERVLVRAATVDGTGLEAFLRTAFQELYELAGAGPLAFTGPAFVRFHGVCDEENATQVEACLPFWADGAQPGDDLPEGTYVRDLPAGGLARTEVAGESARFPEILTAYDAVAEWVTRHGFAFAGPVRLTYLRWTGTPDHPDNRMEIAWPFEDPAEGTLRDLPGSP